MSNLQQNRLVILTVAYHSDDALKLLVEDLNQQTYQPYKWIIVNNSLNTSGPIKLSGDFEILHLKGRQTAGFGEGCNLGFDCLQSLGWNGWVWLLNPDIRLPNNKTLELMQLKLKFLPQNCMVGTAVYDQNMALEKSAGWIDSGLRFRRRIIKASMYSDKELAVDWISGCSFLIKPSAHEILPRFEERLPLYYEDMDLCLRLSQLGVPVFWISSAMVIHNKGTGSNINFARRLKLSTCSYIRFLQRHNSGWVLCLLTIRLLLKALFIFPLNPQHSLAVLSGWFDAFREPLK